MNPVGTYLRWCYRGGRPNLAARIQNVFPAMAFALGLNPRRLAVLHVTGRRTGRTIRLPVIIADHDGHRYLVAMCGAEANWVRNVKAADGHAALRHGRREAVRLVAVDAAERAPILKAYLQVAVAARAELPVNRKAPLREFEKIAADYPCYRIDLPDAA